MKQRIRCVFVVVVAFVLVLTLAACSVSSGSGDVATAGDTGGGTTTAAGDSGGGGKNVIYVMTPTATHGWNGQCAAFAMRWVDEINAAGGEYSAQHWVSKSGAEVNDQIDQLISNNDAAGLVINAMDDDAASGQMRIYDAGIPWISCARIIDSMVEYALINVTGDNPGCGAFCAAWLVEKGFKPGDTLVQFTGATNTDATWRSDGYYDFLLGTEVWGDKDGTITTIEDIGTKWTQEQVDALKNGNNYFNYVCDWSNDKAKGYIESDMQTWVASAESTGGRIFFNSQDDEMTMALIESLASNVFSDDLKQRVEALDLYCTGVGGMEELYEIMRGNDANLTPIVEQYFDGLVSGFMSPAMILDATGMMFDYLNDPDGFWDLHGVVEHEIWAPPVWAVDSSNAKDVRGFDGRGG